MNNIRLPKIRNVTIKDPLFGAYAALVAESIVPYPLGICLVIFILI